MHNLRKVIALLVILVTAPAAIYAQMPGFLQRIDIGYSYASMIATYNGINQVYTPSTNSFADTTVKNKVYTTGGFGGSISTFIPCKQLGEKSMLAISVGVVYNIYTWGSVYKTLVNPNEATPATVGYTDSITNSLGYKGTTISIAMPISLDFKFGNEALTNKNARFCATIGGGINPVYTGTTFQSNLNQLFTGNYKSDNGTGFGVQPFVKFEGGVRGGLVWKIRALYSFGNYDLINKSSSADAKLGLPSTFTLTSNSSFTLSFVVDPFSFTWKKKGWWDY